jgi:hypothetical protein
MRLCVERSIRETESADLPDQLSPFARAHGPPREGIGRLSHARQALPRLADRKPAREALRSPAGGTGQWAIFCECWGVDFERAGDYGRKNYQDSPRERKSRRLR